MEALLQASPSDAALCEVRGSLVELIGLIEVRISTCMCISYSLPLPKADLMQAMKRRLLGDDFGGAAAAAAAATTANATASTPHYPVASDVAPVATDAEPGSLYAPQTGEPVGIDTLCMAPLTDEWGRRAVRCFPVSPRAHLTNPLFLLLVLSLVPGSQHHAAVVTWLDSTGQQCRVLFTHPQWASMKTCPHFLEGRCFYGAASCRFSHGHVLPITDLRPHRPVDIADLQTSAACLVCSFFFLVFLSRLWKPV